MRHHPRPPPRLWPIVLATLAGMAILIGLGIWQIQRLQWKEGLIAEFAAKAQAEPIDLAAAEARIASGENPEFIKVTFRASYRHDSWKKMLSTYEGGQGWSIITPAVTTDGYAVIVDRGRLPGQRLENFDTPPGEQQLTGVIRTYSLGRSFFDPDNDPKANLWYWWDVPDMLSTSSLPQGLKPFPFVIQLLPGTVASEFPRPPEPKSHLTNNHLGYAITWFGLALALAVVAFVYLRSLRKDWNA
jgi:surfeit locus 1 family protein